MLQSFKWVKMKGFKNRGCFNKLIENYKEDKDLTEISPYFAPIKMVY